MNMNAVERLNEFSDNYRDRRPWRLFLELIDGADGTGAELGYLELGMLGDALREYVENPNPIRAEIGLEANA